MKIANECPDLRRIHLCLVTYVYIICNYYPTCITSLPFKTEGGNSLKFSGLDFSYTVTCGGRVLIP